MSSNVYTKDEIIQELASEGFFVDTFTLESFFKIWKIEAIFEDENGGEFFDQNVIKLVMEKLFNKDNSNEDEHEHNTFESNSPQIIEQVPTTPSLNLIDTKESSLSDKEKKPNVLQENIILDDEIIKTPKAAIEEEQIKPMGALEALVQDEITIKENSKNTATEEPKESPKILPNEEIIDILDIKDSVLTKPKEPQQDFERPCSITEQDEIEIKRDSLIVPIDDDIQSDVQPSSQPARIVLLPDDEEAQKVLDEILLTDGTPLVNEIDKMLNSKHQSSNAVTKPDFDGIDLFDKFKDITKKEDEKKKAPVLEPLGITDNDTNEDEKTFKENAFATDMVADTSAFDPVQDEVKHADNDDDFDDLSLLSESIEAQEKFRDYIVSELNKKNIDVIPKNEISPDTDTAEKILSAIAKAVAKKITKQVSQMCANDAKYAAQIDEMKEKAAQLEIRNRELEKQNKKLRLLLTESNKNLNSYKPSIFGLYKKTIPGKN